MSNFYYHPRQSRGWYSALIKMQGEKPMAKEPQYAMWEYWSRDKKGVPVSTFVPARWMPGEAWALIDGAWQRVNDADVGNEARLLDKEA